jgi:hypothetical protein
MHQLIVFLSSTVDDLGGVRDEIAAALERFGIKVWRSETNDFPVKAGVSSHDACLEAARTADVLVTLIGTRYGGSSSTDSKSITWCEYDAATAASVYPIVLIRKDVNDLAKRIHEERLKLAKKKPGLKDVEADAKLQTRFPDVKPYVHNLPAQQRFIDAVRKGHVDNWVKMTWSGTTDEAVNYILSKLASLLISLTVEAEESDERNDALRRLLDWFAILHDDVRAGRRTPTQAVGRILELCEEYRRPLFGFNDEDRFNFMLFVRNGNVLSPEARRNHPDIPVKNRSWKVGEGHAGTALLQPTPLVTPYLPDTSAWTTTDAEQDVSDRANYASAVSVPLVDVDGNADRVFIVTSSRKHHFNSGTQREALTCATLGRILGTLSRLEPK